MTKNFFQLLAIAFLGALVFSSCKKDPTSDPTEKTLYEKAGFFLVNEGTDNGSLYFYESEAKVMHKDVFQAENGGATLGKFVQSATKINGQMYLPANGSGKVEVVGLKDMKHTATISGLAIPRYVAEGDGSTAYISQWGSTGSDGKIMVINTDNNTVTDSIVIGGGPEQLLFDDGKLYVPNSGGWGGDSTLFVINSSDNTVSATLEVGGCPTQILKSDDGAIWVMAAGCFDDTWAQGNGHISRLEGGNVTNIYEFPNGPLDNLTESPDGTMLFVTSTAGIFRFNKATKTFDTTPVVSGYYYSMDIDQDNKKLYLGQSNSGDNGKVYVYDLGADNMPTLSDSLDAGVQPGEFYFQN